MTALLRLTEWSAIAALLLFFASAVNKHWNPCLQCIAERISQ